jgi:hypothetical protein
VLQHALKAQARGLHIFPVAAGQKVPHRLAGQWGETATNDLNKVIHFWTSVDPQANIGIACKPSQLLVVDLDVAKEDWKLRGTDWEYLHEAYGPRVNGEELWDEMQYKLRDTKGREDTYTVRTGSGGTHLYYWWPSAWPRISQASPVKGVIDVRGNGGQYGGYVLAEGSVTESGPYYELWNGQGVQLAPQWLQQLVAERPHVGSVRRPGGIRQPSAVSWSGLEQSVREAGEGNRNNALLWAARAMCSDGASEEEAQRVLGQAATDAGLPYFEIERTIESAYRIQRQKEGL